MMTSFFRAGRLLRSASVLAVMTGIVSPASVLAQEGADTLKLSPVTVTAQKREEDLQDVAASVQAFDEAAIERLNISRFEDYARFAPSLSYATQGPGRTKLVIRGVAESSSSRSGESSAGIYLDEQPVTSNAQTPDVRIVDVERIEVLSGPQGTLYGASSQSGTLKIITNKPDPGVFEGSAEVTAKTLEEGGASYDLQAMVNLPLVADRLALRIVAFQGEEGGSVDNVPGLTPGGTLANTDAAGDDLDSIRTTGGRAALRLEAAPDWSLTASYAFQSSEADGLSDYDPLVGDLQTVKFFDEFYKDDWNQAALTAEGDLGFASLIVTASHFRRDIDSIADSTAYMQFLTGLAVADPVAYVAYDFGADPTGFYDFRLKERRSALEARLASRADAGSRLNWLIGAFYETIEADTVAGANVRDYPLTPSFASYAAYLSAPTDIYFFQQVGYDQDQAAVFGEVSYRLTDQLTATIGARYFDANNDLRIATEIPQGLPIEQSDAPAPESGFTPKLNLAWTPGEDLLAYATYSQGFRLGGANRDRENLAVPKQYDADKLTNYELGLKAGLLGGRVQVNGAAFFMTWDDFQLEIRNPDPDTFYFVTANVGQAEISGAEIQVDARLTERLQAGLAGTLLSAQLSEPTAFLDAPAGARLPVTPEQKASVYGEYRWPLGRLSGEAYLRADYSYTGSSVNSIDQDSARELEAYSQVNLQAGLEFETWTLTVFANNLGDARGLTYLSPADYENSRTSIRPREFGVTLSKSF